MIALAAALALGFAGGWWAGFVAARVLGRYPIAEARYVTFSEAGVTVDLAAYLATEEGRAAVRRACSD